MSRWIIGRAPTCEVIVDHPKVSRTHAQIVYAQGAFLISNLSSGSKTLVNGVEIQGAQPIKYGDSISLGSVTLDTRHPPLSPIFQTGPSSIPHTGPSTTAPSSRPRSALPWILITVSLLFLGSIGLFLWKGGHLSTNNSESEVSEEPEEERSGGSSSDNRFKGAREVERMDRYDYVSERVDCEDTFVDAFKESARDFSDAMIKSSRVSDAEARRIGAPWPAIAARQLGGSLHTSGRDVEYIKAIAKPMLAHVERKSVRYTFHVLENSMVNAFALPGGYLIFTTGLLREVRNEAELAGVIGHEIAHVDKRHCIASLERARALGLDTSDEKTVEFFMKIAELPFHSAMEEQADIWGSELAHRVGYSTIQSVHLFERWADRSNEPRRQNTREKIIGQVEDILGGRVHPKNRRRACKLKQKSYDFHQKFGHKVRYVGTTNLHERIPLPRQVY